MSREARGKAAQGSQDSERASAPLRARVLVLDTACCALGALIHDQPGLVWVVEPSEADILLVAGPVNRKAGPELRALYEAIPHPKRVLAVGSCSRGGGAFRSYPAVLGGARSAVPVDAKVSGCPPKAEAVMEALASLVDSIERDGRAAHAHRRG